MNEENKMTAEEWPGYEEPSATDQTHMPSVWYS